MNTEEATRLCIRATRSLDRDYDYPDRRGIELLGDALESGDLCIVSQDLLRTLQKAGVLVTVWSGNQFDTRTTAFCQRLINKVAPGEEVLVSGARLAALESENKTMLRAIEDLTGEPPTIGVDSGRGVTANDLIQMSGRVGMVSISSTRLTALEKVAQAARMWSIEEGEPKCCHEQPIADALSELDALDKAVGA